MINVCERHSKKLILLIGLVITVDTKFGRSKTVVNK